MLPKSHTKRGIGWLAILITLAAVSTARAQTGPVNFDDAATNSGMAGGIGSFAISSSNLQVASTPTGGEGNLAIGAGATVTGTKANFNIAIGPCASAGATSFCQQANTGSAVNGGNTAIGLNAQALGNNATAIGGSNVIPLDGTRATADGASAFGGLAKATALNATAIGTGAKAGFANSAAFGTGATVTTANQQMFGTSSNSYTMAGLTTTSTAAQSGPLQIVTSDSSGTLGTNTAAGLGLATTSQVNTLSSQIGAINSQLGVLSSRIDDVNAAARRGIAATAAMAYAPTPSRPGATTFAINGSAYENTGGVGIAFEHRFANTRIPVYFSGAYGNGGGREHVGRAGLAFEIP
jgi:hypothetical protein